MITRLIAVMCCVVVLSVAGCSAPATKGSSDLPVKGSEGVVEKGTTRESAKDTNEGVGGTAVEVPTSGSPKVGGEPNDVLVSLGDKRLTMENITWRLAKPRDEEIYVLSRTWLDTELLYEEAKRRGITEDPKAQFFADLNAKRAYGDELQKRVRDAVKVSDEAVQAYYDTNKETSIELMEPGRLDFVHVRVATREEAANALAKVKSGTSMEEVAKMVSIAPDAKEGGVIKRHPLNWVRNELGVKYLSALKAAKDGDIIGPIAVDTDDGDAYEIALKTGESGGKPKPFDEVKEEIRAAILRVEQVKALRELVSSLEQQAGSAVVKSARFLELEQIVKKAQEAGRRRVSTRAAREGEKSGEK